MKVCCCGGGGKWFYSFGNGCEREGLRGEYFMIIASKKRLEGMRVMLPSYCLIFTLKKFWAMIWP